MRTHYGTVIVGGGPAGLAPLVSAARQGRLTQLLAKGLAVIEQGPAIGAGRLGDYAITSDSTAETFLTAVTGHADPCLGVLDHHPLTEAVRRYGKGAVPLRLAGAFMALVGEVLHRRIVAAGGLVLTDHRAQGARQEPDGSWAVRVCRNNDGADFHLRADHLVLSLGAEQRLDHFREVEVADRAFLPLCGDRIVLSDIALRPEGVERIARLLQGKAAPRVAIVGGSTSALAAAGLLVRSLPDMFSAPGSITVLHRTPLRVFYPSAESALAADYRDFGHDDICPVSGFVHRFGGFRLDSRDLVMRLKGIGGAVPEPRIQTVDLANQPASHAALERADIVIAALGYRPNLLPLQDNHGEAIGLAVADGAPLVDGRCRVVAQDGSALANLFGIGLAAGFRPRGALGGEPSFKGQVNGLWLWQNDVGALIVDALLTPEPALAVPRPEIVEAVYA